MADEDVEMVEEWDRMHQTQWRGLSLSDPVKNVEVCHSCLTFDCSSQVFAAVGQVAFASCISQGQGTRQTAHRFV